MSISISGGIGGGGGVAVETDPTALKKANNLSDLTDINSARGNIGVQSSVENAESQFLSRMSASEFTIPMATNWSVSTSAGGTVAVSEPSARDIFGSFSASGFSQTTLDSLVVQKGFNTITPSAFRWNRRVVISFRMQFTTSTTSSSVRAKVHFGTAGGAGIGIQKWGHQTVRFLNHDGTTERVIETSFTPVQNQNYDFLIDADGLGNSKCYIDGVLVAESTQSNLTNTNSRFQIAAYSTQLINQSEAMNFRLSNLKFKSFD